MSTEKTTDILAVLATLVEFETTSRESNLGLIEWVRDYLGGHGVDAQLIYDRNQSKANLFATIGPAVDGGIILSGHTDVVPAADQQWDSHPFRASIRDNKLYGRGASDMKGFLACVLEQLPSWKNQPLLRTIHLAFDYRYLAGVDPARIFDPILEFKDRLVAEMRLLDAEANIGLHRDESCLPLNADEHSPIAALVKALARNTSTRKVAFSTEAGYFERQGIAAIVCGPGSIEQAHRANEYMDIDQLIACRHFLNKLGVSLCDR